MVKTLVERVHHLINVKVKAGEVKNILVLSDS